MSRLCFLLFFFSSACMAQNYQSLHHAAVVVDTHNDVLSTASMRGMKIDSDLSGKTHSDIARLRKGGVDVQVFSVFCNERFGKDTAFAYANIEIDSLYAVVRRNKRTMAIVGNPQQLQQAVKQKKLACMLGVEGGHMIEDRLEYLDSFYKRGVRYMTLTWNNSTSWATSAYDEEKAKQPVTGGHKGLKGTTGDQSQAVVQDARAADAVQGRNEATGQAGNEKVGGLTPFGEQVVRRMNKLGMMVDLSHVGEQTFRDALAITTRPVIVSHSCVHALCPVPRNLKDDQIKAIGRNGGVIHLNFYSGFLDSNYTKRLEAFNAKHQKEKDSLVALQWPAYEVEEWLLKNYATEAEGLQPPLSLLIDHIDYIVRMVGINHVGLGSDFDGISSAPRELRDVTAMPLITKALLQRGYSAADIRKVLGGNFLRVFAANQKN